MFDVDDIGLRRLRLLILYCILIQKFSLSSFCVIHILSFLFYYVSSSFIFLFLYYLGILWLCYQLFAGHHTFCTWIKSLTVLQIYQNEVQKDIFKPSTAFTLLRMSFNWLSQCPKLKTLWSDILCSVSRNLAWYRR